MKEKTEEQIYLLQKIENKNHEDDSQLQDSSIEQTCLRYE